MASYVHNDEVAAQSGINPVNNFSNAEISNVHHHDPALDVENQHTHPHLHHGHLAQGEPLAYVNDSKTQISSLEKGAFVGESKDHVHTDEKNFDGSDSSNKDHLGSPGSRNGESAPASGFKHKLSRHYAKIRIFIQLAIWLLFTAWWIVGLVLHRDRGWLIPFLLYLCITIRMITFHLPAAAVLRPIKFIWKNSVSKAVHLIPKKIRLPLAAAGSLAILILGSMVGKEVEDNTRANRAISIFGLLVFIFCFWATSKHRSLINWQAVIVGMLAQFVLAVFVLQTKAGFDIFNFVAFLAKSLLGFSAKGTTFLLDAETVANSTYFVVIVLPNIIFFVAIVSLLYYWGALQWAVGKFAVLFFWGMNISGAEAVVAAATPFIGQGESAMLIKPFIAHLTDAELHQVLTSGFATVSGSILGLYIFMGISPLALISSCVMSVPASIALSKLRYPETEEPLTAGKVVIPENDEEKAANSLHAFANGGWLGLKIAGMILSSLLVILALLGLVNALLTWWGHYFSINNLTIDLVIGYLFYPIAWLLGVRKADLLAVGRLIGTKVIANEVVAFGYLVDGVTFPDISPRSTLIATFALCGFGNISSIGIQIGVLSQIAPGRSGDISKVAVSALFAGVFSTLSSASIAAMLITDPSKFVVVKA